jgi:PPM family protein phosphatase
MQVEFWATTDVGRARDHNEDNFLVDSELNLFVVCDGMGGHAGGEVASALSVQTIHEVVSDNRKLLEAVSASPADRKARQAVLDMFDEAIVEASRRVYAASQRDAQRDGMGTTCTAVVVAGQHAFVGHVGDSRLYRIRTGAVEQLTDDHSLLNEMIRQGRAQAGDSIPNQNAVTRAVGVSDTIEVDTFEVELESRDRYLICSDGLSGYVEDADELLELLDGEDLESIVHTCISHALRGGGKDNITAIVLDVEPTVGAATARPKSRFIDLLAATPYFSNATPRELMNLARLAEPHGFEAGATIVERGASADAMCLIVKGSVGVLGEDTSVTLLEPGDVFGVLGLFIEPAALAYEALEPVSMLVLRREPLFELLRSHPELSAKFMFGAATTFAKRLRPVPPELRFEPQRWAEVSLSGDETPAPGALILKDRRGSLAGEGGRARTNEQLTTKPFKKQIQKQKKKKKGPPPLVKPDEEPEDMSDTMQIDLRSDNLNER